jgi:hypothetical protein
MAVSAIIDTAELTAHFVGFFASRFAMSSGK